MSRHWPYVAITALLAAVVAVWAIPHLGDSSVIEPETGLQMGSELLHVVPGSTHVLIQGNDLLGISLAIHIDGLAAQVLLLAVGVGLLVQIYSTTYLGHHPRYRSYALIIILFLLGMITVVAADDLFVLLIGWEVMGVCSYLLIGHEWQTPAARAGAAKAFLMTRIADLGLLVGILVIGQTYGTYRISEVLLQGPKNSTAIGLLVLVAVVGKSAQFPLQSWLPDAMPGPTPITALIHAATMVAAGVYLVARLLPILADSSIVMDLLAVIAAITMLLGALFALAQDDLKRALAWSTVSQLAFMFAALATGDAGAGTDHLISHGAFKALLFLGCGCLMHAVGSSALSAMGGLRRAMPTTFWSMTVGFAALAGVIPTVGFFSKDSVLESLHVATGGGGPLGSVFAYGLFAVALLTSLLTAAYATRLWLVTFFGPAVDGHESSRAMTVPVVILAVATLALSIGQPFHLGIAVLSTAVAALGVGFVVLRWRSGGGLDVNAPRLADGLGLDSPYSRWIPAAMRGVSTVVVDIDRDGVDAYPRASAAAAGFASQGLDLFQSRNVQRYVTLIAAGVMVLTAAAVIWT
ncbi:proton-conducting transporter membrane subunit [Aeromicrobium sp.]|uniref:NADH-quinone oxidoreductase subunit 5 family protein n=1 Tax=Aeromicrobium sp. TaxID=1871063 RepID=UPI0019AFE39F|nr:proton-conducting transporter membrane subunit [Aeromicrobium sp.]MBC7631811.1 NADH-quinone oxidoreductase subunit L [Aeromicrobium sp.]